MFIFLGGPMGPIHPVWAVAEWSKQVTHLTIPFISLRCRSNSVIVMHPCDGQRTISYLVPHPSGETARGGPFWPNLSIQPIKKVMLLPPLHAKFVSFVRVHGLPPSSEPFWDMGKSGTCHETFCCEQIAMNVLP